MIQTVRGILSLLLVAVLLSVLSPQAALGNTTLSAGTLGDQPTPREESRLETESQIDFKLEATGRFGCGTLASSSLLAARGGGKWTKEVVERSSRGADGASSRHIIEKLDGKTNSVTHQVTNDGKVIHQHQTHVGKHGTTRQFPDEWVEYPTIPPGGNK